MNEIAKAIERTKRPVTMAELSCGCLPIVPGHRDVGEQTNCEDHGTQMITDVVRTWAV